MRRTLIRFGLLLAVIIAAHVALWQSAAPFAAKVQLTLLNAAVWAVVLLPAIGVGLWLRAQQDRNKRS